MPVRLSSLSFILVLFYCLGVCINRKHLMLIGYVMKSGLHDRGIQELSRAPLGLTGWLHSLVTWVVSASGLSTLLRAVWLLPLGQRSVHSQVQEGGGFCALQLCTGRGAFSCSAWPISCRV